jgi:hypothetical protein
MLFFIRITKKEIEKKKVEIQLMSLIEEIDVWIFSIYSTLIEVV